MKKLLIVLLAIVMVGAVSVPMAAAAGGHGFRGGGHFRGGFHGGFRGHGCFGCGFGFGFFSGVALGGLWAAPYYYYPPPYYYYPPAATYSAPQSSCYTQPGYWSQAPMNQNGGFTTYQNVWVPAQTVCR
jgi:hypothetical protein